MSDVVITAVHPESLGWFPDFIKGLGRQSNTNFHLVVVLDSVDLSEKEHELLNLHLSSYQLIKCSESPLNNRIRAIEASKSYGAQRIAAIDSDDIPAPNWFECMMNHLADERDRLVFCDLKPMNTRSEILGEAHFAPRFSSDQAIETTILNHGNPTGFGNTAFYASLVPTQLSIPSTRRAPDWGFFFHILKTQGNIRYAPTHILYRQHGENLAGLPGCRNPALLDTHLQTKFEHLKNFPRLNAGDQADPRLYEATIRRLKDHGFRSEYWERTKVHQLRDGLMWWEDIQVYKDML